MSSEDNSNNKNSKFVKYRAALLTVAMDRLDHEFDDTETVSILLDVIAEADEVALAALKQAQTQSTTIDATTQIEIIQHLEMAATEGFFYELAVRLADRLIELEPTNADHYLDKVSSMRLLGQSKEALPVVDEAIAFESSYEELFLVKAYLLKDVGDKEGAEECYDRAEALDPSHPVIIAYRIATALNAGDHSRAYTYLRKAVNEGDLVEPLILADKYSVHKDTEEYAHFIMDAFAKLASSEMLTEALADSFDEGDIYTPFMFDRLMAQYRGSGAVKTAFMFAAKELDKARYQPSASGVNAYDDHIAAEGMGVEGVGENVNKFDESEFDAAVGQIYVGTKGVPYSLVRAFIGDDPGGIALETPHEVREFLAIDESSTEGDIRWVYEYS